MTIININNHKDTTNSRSIIQLIIVGGRGEGGGGETVEIYTEK